MRKLTLILLFFSLYSTTSFSQTSQEKQMEELKIKVERDKNAFIDALVTNLEVDEFQEQIIKQNLQSYFDEQQKVYALNSSSYAQKEQLELLNINHFNELQNICSEDVISKIRVAVLDPIKYQKKNKKKRKNKKKN